MKRLKVFAIIFCVWTLLGTLSKLAFILVYHTLLTDASFGELLSILWVGLRLDVAIAGYLSLLPALLLIASLWYVGKALRWVWRGYFALTSFVSLLGYVVNLGLYGYWGFPLDSTPLLYIRTSPADAMASMTFAQMVILPLLIIALSVALFWLFMRLTRTAFTPNIEPPLQRSIYSLSLLLLGALLIIPIRGGFSTGTNHTGSVYFSTNTRLNHAAVNPLFCFVESVTHQKEIGTKYRFLEPEEADKIFSTLCHTELRADAPAHRYNVVLICLESFSKYLMAEQGHVKDVVPNLERLSREGLYFTHFYANSFRTDRAMVSVLSALPAQPTMSIMDLPRKSTSLPSLASAFNRQGYTTTFYYGGDANYSNMRSYIVGTGFQQLVSDESFPSRMRTGKWGVPDGPVFDRMLDDIRTTADSTPFFRAVMTGSSHEPFDVPYESQQPSPELNAFAYTDHCLGQFIQSLRQMPCWKNTLVVIVPDHLGAYPEELDNYQLWRYELPLIMTGGVISQPQQVTTIGSQVDIAATVLGMMGMTHDEFTYSKDLLDSVAPHFAFFTIPDAMGMVTDTSYVIHDNTSQQLVVQQGPDTDHLLRCAKSYLQKLYDDIEKR